MKKFTSLFALLSCLCVVSAQAIQAPDPVTIYVDASNISDAKLYWWGATDVIGFNDSPLISSLTQEIINGTTFYKKTLTPSDANEGVSVIFWQWNDYNGKTSDITNLKASQYYYKYNGGKNYTAAIVSLGISVDQEQIGSFEFIGENMWGYTYTPGSNSDFIFKLIPNGYSASTNIDSAEPSSWFNNSEGNFVLKHSNYNYSSYYFTASWNPNWDAAGGWNISVEGLDPVYTVVGDEALVGSFWNLDDPNNEMIDGGDLYYSLQKTVFLNPGRYGFKVVTNHKYTESWPGDDNWWVNISEAGVYNLSFVFDRGNGDLLSCNGWDEGPSTDVVLELTDETPFTATTGFTVSSALYSRECTNQWGTLCLPFEFSAAQSGVTFYEMTNVTTGDNGAITFTPIVGTNIEAGQPVAFKLNDGANYLNVESSDENGVAVVTIAGTSDAVQGWSMHGTFTNTTLNNVYVIQANEIHPTGSGLSIKPYRAWFSGSVSGAPLRIEVADTEGLQFVEQEDGTVKAYYDLQGRKLDSARKGLVIENGKIIMVK